MGVLANPLSFRQIWIGMIVLGDVRGDLSASSKDKFLSQCCAWDYAWAPNIYSSNVLPEKFISVKGPLKVILPLFIPYDCELLRLWQTGRFLTIRDFSTVTMMNGLIFKTLVGWEWRLSRVCNQNCQSYMTIYVRVYRGWKAPMCSVTLKTCMYCELGDEITINWPFWPSIKGCEFGRQKGTRKIAP